MNKIRTFAALTLVGLLAFTQSIVNADDEIRWKCFINGTYKGYVYFEEGCDVLHNQRPDAPAQSNPPTPRHLRNHVQPTQKHNADDCQVTTIYSPLQFGGAFF